MWPGQGRALSLRVSWFQITLTPLYILAPEALLTIYLYLKNSIIFVARHVCS